MENQILHFIHPWYENKDFVSVMVSTREISRFGGGPMAQPEGKTSTTCTKHNEDCKVGGRRLARTELRIEQRLYIGELPYSPDSSVYAPSTNEGDEDDFDYGTFVD